MKEAKISYNRNLPRQNELSGKAESLNRKRIAAVSAMY